ncbi:MAG TPA: DUF1629 domain-containing protein [Kofleriaceae bacterium]|nr:DUF1629 domain-containing protein [Kofleriaceae bacterium]
MTEVYEPIGAEGFEFCHPERQDDFETFNVQVDGTRRRATWQSIPVHLVHEDRGKKLAASDSPWLGSHALILRRSPIEKLGALLQEYGEILPLICEEAELFTFNATRILDALDEQASSVIRFSSGRIMHVSRYVFRPEVIGDTDIFKIPNLRVSPTYVSERVVQAWASGGFRGLVFNKVWSG